jgi:hypothetical protein
MTENENEYLKKRKENKTKLNLLYGLSANLISLRLTPNIRFVVTSLLSSFLDINCTV